MSELSDAAKRRLSAYCSRAVYSRSEVADNGRGRDVRVVNADLRRIIWRDTEVRDVLLRAGEDRNAWDALVGQVDVELALPLLDVVSAMSLEASDCWNCGGVFPSSRRKSLGR
jgi:hypothetical protein